MSFPPPAANGTMTVTGRVGYVCAAARCAAPDSASADDERRGEHL